MNERILWIVAVVLVGAATFFGGRQLGIADGQASRTAAQQQFFAQRGGGQGGQGGQAVSGQVAAINGGTLSLTLNDKSTVQVALAADGVVREQVTGKLADIKVGDRVVAIGPRSGDTVTAATIQVGGGFGGRQGGQGAAPAGGQGSQNP